MIGELLKVNCSTLFMLKPVVGVSNMVLQDEFGMINSYLQDKSREDLNGDYLFVLFKPIDFDYFELFLEEQAERNKDFVEDYDYAGGYVVIVYKIPEILKDDFELFKKGKYSKLSTIVKECYEKEIKFFLEVIPGFQHEVFSKANRLKEELEEKFGMYFTKDMELWQLPDITGKEVLDIQSFIKPKGNGKTECLTEGDTEGV